MNIIKLQGEAEKRKGIYYEYDVDSIPLDGIQVCVYIE